MKVLIDDINANLGRYVLGAILGAALSVVAVRDWDGRLDAAEAQLDTLRRLEVAVETLAQKPVITQVRVYDDCAGAATFEDGQLVALEEAH